MTEVSIQGTRFLIDGRPTYAGRTSVEGLLFNVRTVNATFDDTLGRVDWWDDDGSQAGNGHAGHGRWTSPTSAEANTARYIAGLADYRAHGVLAVNLCLQGGHPLNGKPQIAEGHGSAGWRPNRHRGFYHNSAYRADGSLDNLYTGRAEAVIDACDQLGMVVLLQLFYFGQDTVLADEAAIKAAVENRVDWPVRRATAT